MMARRVLVSIVLLAGAALALSFAYDIELPKGSSADAGLMQQDGREHSGPQAEPLFVAVARDDPEMERAHEAAAESMGVFKEHVVRTGGHACSAKLRFRDPEFSEESGEDQFLYVWLGDVRFHEEEQLFSGSFFEVPEELTQWHRVGERLAFRGADVFDWKVDEHGRVHGGFTLRVVRERLPERERARYDDYVGAVSWEPLPSPRAR